MIALAFLLLPSYCLVILFTNYAKVRFTHIQFQDM